MKQECLNKIKRMLNSDINFADDFVVNDGKLFDAVSMVSVADRERYYADDQSPSTLFDHVYRRLGHIIVSPKDVFNTLALNECYTYYDEETLLPGESAIVNYNESTAIKFIKKLIKDSRSRLKSNVSKFNADNVGRRAAAGRKKLYFLDGPRGSGKTFFLNFIFSKFHQMFDDERVIWVRINLVNEYCTYSNSEIHDLADWLFAQLTKIILRYYDFNSVQYRKNGKGKLAFNYIEILTNYIEKECSYDENLSLVLKQKLLKLKQIFQNQTETEPISKGLVPDVFGRYLFDFLQRNNISVIFVLDGCDKIEALVHQEKKFQWLCSAIDAISNTSSEPNTTILLVTRTQNLPVIKESSRQGGGSIPRSHFKSLKPVSFENILEKRFQYLEREIEQIASLSKLEWDSSISLNHLNNFRNYLLERSRVYKFEFFDAIDKVYDSNIRAKTQSIQTMYCEFLLDKGLKHYTIIESLCRAGRAFPPKPYRYEINNGVLQRYPGEQVFDNHFLPNIFTFPTVNCKPLCEVEFLFDSIPFLAGLRISQILDNFYAYKNSTEKGNVKKPVNFLTVDDICCIASSMFGYQQDLIVKMIEEFGEYELFRLGGVGLRFAFNTKFYKPQQMPKIKYILSHLIYDISYLNMCSIRTMIPSCFLSKNEFFSAKDYFKVPLRVWVASKIKNAISIYQLINYYNKLDLLNKNNGLSNLGSKKHKLIMQYNDIYSFILVIKQSIIRQCNSILNEIENRSEFSDLEYILKQLTDHENNFWVQKKNQNSISIR